MRKPPKEKNMIKVLIVDDTKTVHTFVKSLCKDLLIEFHSVYNGQEAVDCLSDNNRFDLILLDWEMPIMNGPATLFNIKSMGLKCPVVMMTTKNSFENISEMLSQGASEYLMKPFTLDIFLEKVNYALGDEVLDAA